MSFESVGARDMADDEFSLDLDGVKKAFTKPKKTAPEKSSPSKQTTKRRLPYVFNRNELLWVAILVLIPLFLSAYFRAQPLNLPAAEEWAKNTVHNYYSSQIGSRIDQQFPNLPEATRQSQISEQLNIFLKENKDLVAQQIQETSGQLREQFQYEDENGRQQTYLGDIDTWFYYRRVRNLAETGHVWDVEVNGVKMDDHMNAPLGAPIDKPDFHSLFSYAIHKILAFFDPKTNVMFSFSIVSVVISALAVIPAFFIGRHFAGSFGGFLAAMVVAINASFLGRSTGGTVDTDPYNVTFPLYIVWAFLVAFESKSFKGRIIWSAVTGILMGLFSYAWSGWWYLFDFIVATLGIFAVFIVVRILLSDKNISSVFSNISLRRTLQILGVFLVFTIIGVSIFSGIAVLKAPVFAIKGVTTIKDPAKLDLWPNVFTTVAELNPSSLGAVVRGLGGQPIGPNFNLGFFIGCMGLVLTMFRPGKWGRRELILVIVAAVSYFLIQRDFFLTHPIYFFALLSIPTLVGLVYSVKHPEVDVKFGIFMTIWFIGTMYAALKGVRFTLLLVPAFALAWGFCLGIFHRHMVRYLNGSIKIPKIIASVTLIVLISLMLLKPLQAADAIGKGQVPIVSDGWWDALKKIDQEAASDAIINSWWDFGHWFKAIADRRVTFDGATQNTPMAHWIGRVLLTENEKEAVGLLRMLDCGSNTAFEVLNAEVSNHIKSVDLIYEIVTVDKEAARQVLNTAGVSTDTIERTLALTHCNPPENYFITSGDMVGKAGVWAHFGSWDFRRAFIYNTVQNQPRTQALEMLQAELGIEPDEALDYYNQVSVITNPTVGNNWIAPWPNYVSQNRVSCALLPGTDTLRCPFNVGLGSEGAFDNVLESAFINTSNYTNSYLVFSVINRQTRQKVQESRGKPSAFWVTEDEGLVRYSIDQPNINFDVLFDTSRPSALMMDPRLVPSTFTKLFFLEGRYMSHFDNFDDRTTIQGGRILTWKVDWDGKEDEELLNFTALYKTAGVMLELQGIKVPENAAPIDASDTQASENSDMNQNRNETPDSEPLPNDTPVIGPTLPVQEANTMKHPIITITTNKGIITAELYPEEAPKTVANFVNLAKSGFYDGLKWHRVEPGFVVQGGDPKGDGTGGSDNTIPLEIANTLSHKKGALGMARSNDPNSARSQFYITLGDANFLDGKYAVFGYVIEGQDVAEKLKVGDTMSKVTVKES